MTDTAKKLGRAPYSNLILNGIIEADKHIGSLGQIGFVVDVITGDIIQMRAFNGIKPGGFVTPMVPAATPAAYAPASYMLNYPLNIPAGEESPLITHNLGQDPTVTAVKNSDGQVAPISVTIVEPGVSLTFRLTNTGRDFDGVAYLR